MTSPITVDVVSRHKRTRGEKKKTKKTKKTNELKNRNGKWTEYEVGGMKGG